MKGPLIVLSGPSGSGKSTVIARLLAVAELPLRLSVSATTRPPRDHEQDTVHYHFWSRAEFEREIAAGEFLEWANVFGNYYGTLRREVEPYRAKGIGVLLDIDVQGAAQVRQKCPDVVTVFLKAPSLAVYEQRLRKRATETEAVIQKRLAGALAELACEGDYRYTVINDNLEMTVAQLQDIIRKEFERGNHAG
jgi:guanylate kinase